MPTVESSLDVSEIVERPLSAQDSIETITAEVSNFDDVDYEPRYNSEPLKEFASGAASEPVHESVVEPPNKLISEPQVDSHLLAYFEQVQMALVGREQQVRILSDECKLLAKKLAAKEEENAMLRKALLKAKKEP